MAQNAEDRMDEIGVSDAGEGLGKPERTKPYAVWVHEDSDSSRDPYLFHEFDVFEEAARTAQAGRSSYPSGSAWVEDRDGNVLDLETGKPRNAEEGRACEHNIALARRQ